MAIDNRTYPNHIRPYRKWKSVTPDDDNDLPEVPRAIYASGTGDIAMVDQLGNEIIVTFNNANRMLQFSPVRIKATGTTATGIYALH